MRILICEDEPSLGHRLKEGLLKYVQCLPKKPQVDLALSLEAIERFRPREGDLLFLDILPPDGAGVEWAQKAREEGCLCDIVYVSSHEPAVVPVANTRP